MRTEILEETWTFLDDYQNNMNIRKKQLEAKDDLDHKYEDDDEEAYDDLEDIPLAKSMTTDKNGQDTTNIFTNKRNETMKLEDFEIKKMVGKGTFGKVFLVQNKKNQKIFAMKVIRKDIIIDNEQFENIQLEKDILFNVSYPEASPA